MFVQKLEFRWCYKIIIEIYFVSLICHFTSTFEGSESMMVLLSYLDIYERLSQTRLHLSEKSAYHLLFGLCRISKPAYVIHTASDIRFVLLVYKKPISLWRMCASNTLVVDL